jgi:aspartyl-tRNA(Asn)/glutamyl-tRNA(Gln) amidotransferase subunit B
MPLPEDFELIIGLETHVQLLTRTKLFCRCSTRFGAAPNTQTCPVCAGLPGALPVMNRHAFRLSLRTAAALNCEIPNFTKWDRKNYFYPDLPKGYQISQYDLPMSRNGYLEISDPKGAFAPKRVGIIRAHLEEDAGKSMHDEAAGKADSRIDLNRAGTPLLEIVSEPDMRSPAEAKAYLNELKLLLMFLEVSDCNMQEGSLRVDANVNLHIQTPQGKIATPIVEIKNMNSFRAVERALAYEGQRQLEAWRETGQRLGDIPKQTRGWDDEAQITRAQRAKEESSDYRYFPDPDLTPVTVSAADIETVRQELGELPAQLRRRLQDEFGLDAYGADVIVNQGRAVADYYAALAQLVGDGRQAGNWVQQDVLRILNERTWSIAEFPLRPEQLAELLTAIQRREIDVTRAKEAFSIMLDKRQSAADAMKALGIAKVDDSQTIEICREILAKNPKIVADVKAGKTQAVGALIGMARKTNPNLDAARVREICLELIGQM